MFFLIPLTAFMINGFVFTFVYTLRRTRTTRSYLVYQTMILIWLLNQLLLSQDLPMPLILFINSYNSVIWISAGMAFIHFLYTIIARKPDGFYYTLLGSTLVLDGLSLFTPLILQGVERNHWTWDLVPGVLFLPAVVIVYLLPTIYGLWVLEMQIRSQDSRINNKSIRLIQLGMGLPVVLGIMSDVVLPHLFGLTDTPRIAASASALQALLIYLAIRYHEIFHIDLNSASGELFANIQDGVVLLDRNRDIVQINDSALKLLKTPRRNHRVETAIRQLIGRIIDQVDSQELTLKQDNQTLHYTLLVMGSREVLRGYLLLIRDLSLAVMEEKHERAVQVAEAANRARRQFFSRISHELRTPLNSIVGLAELTMQTDLDPQQYEYLELLLATSDRLTRLVNVMIDLSQIEAGNLELHPSLFRLNEILIETVRLTTIRAEAGSVDLLYRIAPDVPHLLIGDPEKLQQILEHVLEYVVRNSAESTIILNVDLVEEYRSRATLEFTVIGEEFTLESDVIRGVLGEVADTTDAMLNPHYSSGVGLNHAQQLLLLMGSALQLESPVSRSPLPAAINETQGIKLFFQLALEVQRHRKENDTLPDLQISICYQHPATGYILEELLESWQVKVHRFSPKAFSDEPQSNPETPAVAGTESSQVILPGNLVIVEDRALANEPEQAVKWLRTICQQKPIILIRSPHDQRWDNPEYTSVFTATVNKPIHAQEFYTLLSLLQRQFPDEPYPEEAAFAFPEPEPVLSTESGNSAPGTENNGIRILLVEDDPLNQDIIASLLKIRGFTIVTADDGKAGLDLWLKQDFHLVITDIQMPELDGRAMVEQMQLLDPDRRQRVPVVALTAHALDDSPDSELKKRFDNYILKPVHIDELLDDIIDYLPDN